jgi:methylated-DNA-protein-cysteine methyltransferase-like protein
MAEGRKRSRKSGKREVQSAAEDHKLQPTPPERIWQVVALIPPGKVASYGQVAALAGMPRHARLVGRTLRELPAGSKLPWHRVVNAAMKISQRRGSGGHALQRRRLEAEGVEFVGERIPRSFRWEAEA